MLVNDKKAPFWIVWGHWIHRIRKHRKSTVEIYRKMLYCFVFTGIFVFVLFRSSPPQRSYLFNYLVILSYLMVAVATAGRLWCAIYIFGRKNKTLCQDGPYSVCRNPLYLFSFIGGIGVVMATDHLLLVIVSVAISFFYYFMVVKSEEKRLLRLFGSEYQSYCTRVPRFLPKFRNYWSREQVEINPHLISRAIVKNMWFFWLLFALEIIKILKRIPN